MRGGRGDVVVQELRRSRANSDLGTVGLSSSSPSGPTSTPKKLPVDKVGLAFKLINTIVYSMLEENRRIFLADPI